MIGTVIGVVILWISGFLLGMVAWHFWMEVPNSDAIIKAWNEELKWYQEQLRKAEQGGYSGYQPAPEVNHYGSTGSSYTSIGWTGPERPQE